MDHDLVAIAGAQVFRPVPQKALRNSAQGIRATRAP
jgi:hypothetical protein